jgi:hypothetical protein
VTGTAASHLGPSTRYTGVRESSVRLRLESRYYGLLGRWRSHRAASLRSSILLAGGPRSGTTWLRDILVDLTGWPMLEEPTSFRRNVELDEIHQWGGRPYRNPDDADPQLAADLERIITGTYLGPNLVLRTRRNTIGLWTRSPVVTKVIDTNLLLPWIATHLPWLRIVELIRHPFAVAASREARSGSVWARSTDITDSYRTFMDAQPAYDGPTVFDSPSEAQVAAWAIEHAWLRDRRPAMSGVIWMRYETLRNDPASELRRLTEALALPGPTDRQLQATERPSRSTHETASTLGHSESAGWQRRYDADQIRRMTAILERYGFPFYGPDELATS